MNNMHKVPVHLDTQDTFLWNFTFRQVLILFVGSGFTYVVVTTDWSTLLATLLCLLFGGLCLMITLLLAFVRIQRRNLDQWLLVAFLHYSSPRVYTWAALEEEQDTVVTSYREEWAIEQEKREEEW